MSFSIGNFSAVFYLILILLDYLILLFLSIIKPKGRYPKHADFDYEDYKRVIKARYKVENSNKEK